MLCIRRKVRMPERQVNNMNRIENLVDLDKVNELKVCDLKKLNKLLGKEEEEKQVRNVLVWGLAIIGAVAAGAAVAYAVYHFFFAQDYLEDFEDDFEDEADDVEEDDDDFFEDEGEN